MTVASRDTIPSQSPLEVIDLDPLADRRVHALLGQYCRLAGATTEAVEPNLLRLEVPAQDRAHFRDRDSIHVALSLDALHSDPDAEIAVLGSPFVSQLIEAIRARATRLAIGLIPPTLSPDPAAAQLTVAVRNAVAGEPRVSLARHPVGRLVARVVVRAGSAVEEHLVESGLFDLVTAAPLGSDVVELCGRMEHEALEPARPDAIPDALPAPRRETGELLQLMLGDLRARLEGEITARRVAAERTLATELARIDRYYKTMLEDPGGRGTDLPDPDTVRAIEAEHRRRRDEEVRRHEVRAVVHPLQLLEGELLVQRGEWDLSTALGRRGIVAASRPLSGAGTWVVACPTCGASPRELVVCKAGHVGCAGCGFDCAVCGEGFCREHGLAACHVDRAPACAEHARTCGSCRRRHCTAHQGVCAEGEHGACTTCLALCGSCGRLVCERHAVASAPSAPRGARRLCATCVRYCEGGTNEPVGVDEVVECATCGRSVCAAHQNVCVVDGRVHCSKHLRRSDRSRRLVCERDRGTCVHEPAAILAVDEVAPCATCAQAICEAHGDLCIEDGRRHCATHLAPLGDRAGQFACAAHRATCHVDGQAYSIAGVHECPICRRVACARHTSTCRNCGRAVCTVELPAGAGSCGTCRQLSPVEEPSDAMLTGAIAAGGGEPRSVRRWRTARDGAHAVVEMDLGWTRRIVFALRHGDSTPETVMTHSLLGSRKNR